MKKLFLKFRSRLSKENADYYKLKAVQYSEMANKWDSSANEAIFKWQADAAKAIAIEEEKEKTTNRACLIAGSFFGNAYNYNPTDAEINLVATTSVRIVLAIEEKIFLSSPINSKGEGF
jgi:hypothetical protein